MGSGLGSDSSWHGSCYHAYLAYTVYVYSRITILVHVCTSLVQLCIVMVHDC